MENQSMFKSNRKRKEMLIVLTIGLALFLVLTLLWALSGVTLALADPGDLYVDGASGGDNPACGTMIAPCQTISYTLGRRASDGDTIHIAAGNYTENLTINGITVMLRGGYTISDTVWLPETGETVIDGDNAERVFVIQGNNSVLENLTITGGYASGASCWGGGVWVTNGEVTIRSSTITANEAECGGAGIDVNDDFGAAHLILESVMVSHNNGGQNGGLNVWGYSTSADVRASTFYSNTASIQGGGIAVLYGSSAVIDDSSIVDNTTGGGGGGIAVSESASAVISGTSIISNIADLGGAIIAGQVTVTLTNVLISSNQSSSGNANVLSINDSDVEIMNSTISDNNPGEAQAVLLWSGALTITNSILWNNGPNLQADPPCPGCFTVNYSDIEGDWTGTGNINENPLFLGNGNYHLSEVSPCIDKGTPTGAPAYDIEGTMRDALPDMGAYEFKLYELAVGTAGSGSGSVSSSPAGIVCGADCTESFANGTVVTLTASADIESTFTGWSGGDCTGTGACVVTMNEAKEVTATFTLNQYDLSVSLDGTGSGFVNSTPAGIDCGTSCTANFDYGTVVTLTAEANIGSTFEGWGGACAGAGDCAVTMTETKAVTAIFKLIQTYLPMVYR